MDKTKILLLALCALLAGAVIGQRSADVAMLAPAPLQLIKPAENPPSAAPAVAPVARATRPAAARPAAVAPAPRRSSAARSTPEPRAEVRPPAPAAFTAPRNAPVVPAPAPAAAAARVSDKGDVAETYEWQAAARMQQGDYREAGELFDAALRNGGKARFAIVHDHSKGNFEKDPKASCVGELILSANEITFAGSGTGDNHHFEASWAEVLDAGANRFFGSGLGGFHVAISPDGKYKNFNLAPRSKDKSEAKLIIDLVNANARKTDRAK